jgi:YjbE family integral membrane protein
VSAFEFLQAILSIVIIDLVLSGDNAVVIGMAARRLSPEQRHRAIIAGAAGAIVLRVLFTVLAAVLLGVPLLQGIGGLVLLWIAYTLLRQEEESAHEIKSGSTLFEAIRTIILADVVMSLDNILAVGGTAHGNLPLLLFGLALSMSLIMFGSNLVASLMHRIPWLIYLGAAILIYTATDMIFNDPIVGRFLPHTLWVEGIAIIALIGAIVGWSLWRNARQQDRADLPAAH